MTFPNEPNLFRDSLLRYAGYANEVGEAFRYQFPRAVLPSYVIAGTYCGADAFYAGYRHYQRQEPYILPTVDALLWQGLASVALPGATINTIVKTSRWAVARLAWEGLARQWTPTAVGLASIPMIIKPIDEGVDLLLDNTTRKWMNLRPED